MPRRDAYLQHLARVPMFSTCSKRELQMVSKRATDVQVDPGRELVHEGRPGYEFFVIVDGKADVSRNGRKVNELGPGDFFGELALLDREPRNATVTTRTPLEVIVLGRPEFDALLAEAPSMARKIMVGMARRLHELDAKV